MHQARQDVLNPARRPRVAVAAGRRVGRHVWSEDRLRGGEARDQGLPINPKYRAWCVVSILSTLVCSFDPVHLGGSVPFTGHCGSCWVQWSLRNPLRAICFVLVACSLVQPVPAKSGLACSDFVLMLLHLFNHSGPFWGPIKNPDHPATCTLRFFTPKRGRCFPRRSANSLSRPHRGGNEVALRAGGTNLGGAHAAEEHTGTSTALPPHNLRLSS